MFNDAIIQGTTFLTADMYIPNTFKKQYSLVY